MRRYACTLCDAWLFQEEGKNICCGGGKVRLRPLTPPNDTIKSLFNGDNSISRRFLKDIRSYNSKFAFTSLGTKNVDVPGRGPPTFKINGRMHHFIGTILPPPDTTAVFAQIYINDEEEQASIRLEGSALDSRIIRSWGKIVNQNNPYAQRFHQMGASSDPSRSFVLKERIGDDRRRYNAPTVSEIAVLMPGDGSRETAFRDVILKSRDGGLSRINEMNPSYDPLHYPLLFSSGDLGWAHDLALVGTSGKKVTLKQFYSFRIMERADEYSVLHRGKRLFHEYLVDMYAKIETSRLDFLRNNQSTIRAELYQGRQTRRI
jgi:hypothetical protein